MENLIAIIGEEKKQFDTKESFIDFVLSSKNMKYTEMPEDKKRDARFMKAFINAGGNEEKIIDYEEILKSDIKIAKDMRKHFNGLYLIDNEDTYVNSLLINKKMILLEKKDAEIFASKGENEIVEKNNYIVLNYFAKEKLEKYTSEKINSIEKNEQEIDYKLR